MSDDEYNKKLQSLQQYIPFLNNMITQLKDPRKKNREQQLQKMVSLHSMITDKKKKLKLETLVKCEDVILKLYDKVKSGGSHTPPLGKPKHQGMPSSRVVQYPLSPTTPSSPSPPHDIPATKPIVIPMEKVTNRGPAPISPVKPTVRSRIDVYGSAAESFRNRSPPQSSRFDIYSTAADSLRNKSPPRRASDLYSMDKSPPRRVSDLYSTAADSLRGPSKRNVFDRLGYHIKPDMSKPPISYADLEALQADGSPRSRSPETFDADDMSLGQLTDLRKKLQKQLSKPESSSVHGKVPSWESINTTVRTTSILPKSPVKAPEPTKAPSMDKQPSGTIINTTARNTTILTKKAVDKSPIRAPESIKTSTGSINIPVIITTTTTLTTKSADKSPVRPPESTTTSAEARNHSETAVSSTILTKKPLNESVAKAPNPIKTPTADQQQSNKADNEEKGVTEAIRVQTDTSSKHSESPKAENSKVKMNLLDKDKKTVSKEVPTADHSVTKPKVDSSNKPKTDNASKPKADSAPRSHVSSDTKSEKTDSANKTRLDSSTKPKSDNVNKPKSSNETKPETDDATKLNSDSETKIKVDSAAKPQSADTKSEKDNGAGKIKTDVATKPRSDDDPKPKVDSAVKPRSESSARVDKSDSAKKPKVDSSSKPKVDDTPKSKNDSGAKPKSDSASRTKMDSATKPKVEGSSKPKTEAVKVLREADCMFGSTLSSIDSKLLDKKKDKKEERRSSVDGRSDSSSKDKSKEKHERRNSSDEKRSDSSSSSSSSSTKSKDKSERISDHKKHSSSHHHKTKDTDTQDDKEKKSKSDETTASHTKSDKGTAKHEANEKKPGGSTSKGAENKAGEGNCLPKREDIDKKLSTDTNEKSDRKLDIEKLCFKLPQTKRTDDDRGPVTDEKSNPMKDEKKQTIFDKPVAEETTVDKPQVYKRLADKYNPKPRKPSIEGTEVKPNPLVKPASVPQISPTPVPQTSPAVKIPFLDNTTTTQSAMSSLSKISSLLHLPTLSQSPSLSFPQQPQTPRPPLLSPTSSVNSIDNEFDFNKKVEFIPPQVSSILANPTTSAIINTVISQFKGKPGLLPTPESGGIQNFARDCSSFVPNQQFGSYLPNFIPDHHQNKLQTPSIQLNMQQNIHYSQPTMSNTSNYQMQQQQQQQRNLMSPMPYGGAPNQSLMGNNNMMQLQRGRPFTPFEPIDEPPPTPINHFDNDTSFYPSRAMTPTPFSNQGIMNPSMTPQHQQEPIQNFPDNRYPPRLGNELLFGHQDKDMRPFEYANQRQTMQRSFDTRDQSWDPRDQPRDPREQSRDPREQSRDPRELLRDPREQSRDTRELSRDPRDNSRDSREMSRDYRERDPRYRARDPRILNRERDGYNSNSNFREREDHSRSSSSYRETRDYDRDSRDPDRDTRDRDTRDRDSRDRDSRDRDSRSRHREIRDPRLNRPSDSRHERSYSRPRSRSRSRADSSFGSPLGSLYTGNDGSKKTGKGYGVQSFKIPKVKKDEANTEEKSDDKAEEKPTKVEVKSTKAEEEPAKAEEKPIKAEEKPAKAEEKPAVDTVGKDDSKMSGKAASAQEDSAKVSSSSEPKESELPKAESTKDTETTEISSSTNSDTLPEVETKITEKPSSETDIINQFLKTLLQNDKTRAAASMFINELSESANDDRLKAIVQTVKTVGKGEDGKTEEVSEELESEKAGEIVSEEVTDKEKADGKDKNESESTEVNPILKKPIRKKKLKKQKKKGKPVAKTSAPVEALPAEESPDKTEESPDKPEESPDKPEEASEQKVQNEQTAPTKPPEETPGEEEVVVTVGERIKNRRRQAASGGKGKKCKTELDMLHEDIKDMFIRDGVLTATGKRMCCLLKDESTSNKNPTAAKKVAEPAAKTKKGSGKSEKFDATSSANSDKLKAMSNVRVLLPKIPVAKMNTSSDSTSDDSKRYSLREGRTSKNYAENDSDDESASKRILRSKPQQEQQPHLEEEKSEDETDNDDNMENDNDKASEEDHSESDHTESESVAATPAPRVPPKKGKVGHRKRFSSWASGIIPKKKRTEKHRTGDDTSAESHVPEKSSDSSSTAETSTAAGAMSTPSRTESEQTTIEDSSSEFIEPDKNYYLKPRMAKMKCKLCKFFGKGITSHYRFEHPDCEVLSSRPHPKMAEQLIQESINEKLDELTDLSANPFQKFSYKCRFCGLSLKVANMTRFYDHITLHTGEYRHNCNNCQLGFTTYKSLREHCKNKHNIDRRNDIPRITNQVFGYICSECNFIQLDKKTVENHANIYHLDDGKKIYRVRLDTPVESTTHSGSPEPDAPDQMSTADDTIDHTEGEDEEEEQQTLTVSNKRPLDNSEPDNSESDVAQPATKKKASEKQNYQTEEIEEPETLPATSQSPALPSTPPPLLPSPAPPPQLPTVSSPVVKKEKEIDMTVFECNTDLQEEEEKIEQERLKTMAELNETVKTHRQTLNFVDELSNRLKNEQQQQQQSPQLAQIKTEPVAQEADEEVLEPEVDPKPVVYDKIGDIAPKKTPKFPESPLVSAPTTAEVVQKDTSMITDMIQKLRGILNDDISSQENTSSNNASNREDSADVRPGSSASMVHSPGATNADLFADESMEDSAPDAEEIQKSPDEVDETKTLVISANLLDVIKQDSRIEYKCKMSNCTYVTVSRTELLQHWPNDHPSLAQWYRYNNTKCQVCQLKIIASEGDDLLTIYVDHMENKHALTNDTNLSIAVVGPPPLQPFERPNQETKTILAAGFLNIIKDKGQLEYACKVPSCMYTTSERDKFVSHWEEDHVLFQMNFKFTRCRLCRTQVSASDNSKNKLLMAFFEHVETQHVSETEPLKRVMLRTRRLSGDKLSKAIPDDDQPDDKKSEEITLDDGGNSSGSATNEISHTTEISIDLEDNPFPFKIAGVVSLAADGRVKVPPLSPISDKSKTEMSSPTGSTVQTTIATTVSGKNVTSVVLKEVEMTPAERLRPWKSTRSYEFFLRTVNDLYKCPAFDCSFSTSKRSLFRRHLTFGHHYTSDILVACVYCWMKTPLSQADIHIYVRHSKSPYSCSECLYRAVCKEYVMVHLTVQHQPKNIVVMLKEIPSLAQPLPRKYSVADNCPPFVCGGSGCQRRFLYESDFLAHVKICPGALNQCARRSFLCTYQCFIASSLITHWQTHGCFPFHCLYCKSTFVKKTQVLEHFSKCHQHVLPEVVDRTSKPANSTFEDYDIAIKNVKCVDRSVLDGVERKKFRFIYAPDDAEAESSAKNARNPTKSPRILPKTETHTVIPVLSPSAATAVAAPKPKVNIISVTKNDIVTAGATVTSSRPSSTAMTVHQKPKMFAKSKLVEKQPALPVPTTSAAGGGLVPMSIIQGSDKKFYAIISRSVTPQTKPTTSRKELITYPSPAQKTLLVPSSTFVPANTEISDVTTVTDVVMTSSVSSVTANVSEMTADASGNVEAHAAGASIADDIAHTEGAALAVMATPDSGAVQVVSSPDFAFAEVQNAPEVAPEMMDTTTTTTPVISVASASTSIPTSSQPPSVLPATSTPTTTSSLLPSKSNDGIPNNSNSASADVDFNDDDSGNDADDSFEPLIIDESMMMPQEKTNDDVDIPTSDPLSLEDNHDDVTAEDVGRGEQEDGADQQRSEAEKEREQEQEQQEQELEQQQQLEKTSASAGSKAQAAGDESDSQDPVNVGTGGYTTHSPFGLIGYQLFRCAICDGSFSNARSFKAHCQESHECQDTTNYAKPYRCAHCSRHFKNPHGLLEHVLYHGQLRFNCSLCVRKFPSAFALRVHMRLRHCVSHTTVVPVIPNKTNLEVDEFILRPKPMDEPPETQEPSQEKDKSAEQKTEFLPEEIDLLPQRHIFNFTVKCALCLYTTKVRTNLVRHLQFHSKEKSVPDIAPVNPVPCLDKNEKMFDKMTNLAISSFSGTNTGRMGGGHKADQKTEENVEYPNYVPSNRRYACCASGCNYICPEESNLRHHLLALHETEPHFMCVHCKFDQITDVDVYLKHLKMHDLHLYKCNYCEFVHNLRHKIERHSSDKHPDSLAKVVTVRALEAELPDVPLGGGDPGQHSAATATDSSSQEPKASTSDNGATSTTSSVDSSAQAQQQQQGPQTKYTKPWQCGMCKYRFVTKDDILVHIQNKHDLDSQYKCTLCSYKSDEKEVFFPHFKHCHPGHDTNIIHVYYKSEYLRSNSSTSGGVAGGGATSSSEAGLDKAFDTTPLWQRDRPRIRHIRGILLDESSSSVLKSSPKNKPIWNTKAAAMMGVDSIDSAIEAVVKGVDKTSKLQTRVSDEIFDMLNEQIKEVEIPKPGTSHDMDPLAVENETAKKKETPSGASTDSSTAGASAKTAADKQSEDAVIILDSDEEELEQQQSNKETDKKIVISDHPTEENETDEETFIPMSSFEAHKDLDNDHSDSEDCGNLVIDCGSMEEALPTFAIARKAQTGNKDQKQLSQPVDAGVSGRTVLTEDMLQTMYSRLVAPAGKSYRCPMCLKGKTKRLSNLVHHILTEMNRNRYTCHVCDHKTITQYSMCTHYKEHHPKMSVSQIIETPLEEPLIWWLQMLIQYQSRLLCQIQDAPIQSETKGGFFTVSCRFCRKWFHNKLVVKEHEIHHWAYTNYTCGHCLIDSPSMEKFFEHSNTIHPRRNYSLKINGPSVNQILSKLRDRTGSSNSCSDREDNDQQTSIKKFFCFYCLETTTSMAELHAHWKSTHETENVQFKYRSEAQLSVVSDTVAMQAAAAATTQQPTAAVKTPSIRNRLDKNDTVYCCSYCHKKDVHSRLKEHHSAEHPRTKFLVYNVICMECPETFDCLKDMRTHFAKSHPSKRLSFCPIDNRVETEGGEMFQCTQCVFRCTTLGSIRYHVRKHVKPVVCNLCGESFPSRFEGKQHYRKTHDKHGTENVGMSKAKMKEYRKILNKITGTKEPEEIFDISMEDDSDDVIAIDVETLDPLPPPPPPTSSFTGGATYSRASKLAAALTSSSSNASPVVDDVVTAVNMMSDEDDNDNIDDILVLKDVEVTKSKAVRRSPAQAGLLSSPRGGAVKRRKVARKSTAKICQNDSVVVQEEYSFYDAANNKERSAGRSSDFKGITTSIEVNKIQTKINVEQFGSIFNIFPRLELEDCGKSLPPNCEQPQDDTEAASAVLTTSQASSSDAVL